MQFKLITYLIYFYVGKDHDSQGAIEGDGAGEHKVANVFSEGTLPWWCWT